VKPDLTDEQVASLSPEERQRRELAGKKMFGLVNKFAMGAMERAPELRKEWVRREMAGLRQDIVGAGHSVEYANKFSNGLEGLVLTAIRLIEESGGGTTGRA